MVARQWFHCPTFWIFVLLVLESLIRAPLPAEAQPFFVHSSTTILRLRDINGNGNALDSGEKRTFFSGSGLGDVAVSRSGVVYTVDNKGRVLKLQDKNGDGDALDSGEAISFRDERASGVHLKLPLSMAVSQTVDPRTGGPRDVVYVMDVALQTTVKLEDVDGNGDAQGANEICFFHESVIEKPLTALRMTTDMSGRVLAVNPNIPGVVRVVDLNQDCHVKPAPSKEQIAECPSKGEQDFVFSEYQVLKDDRGADPDLLEPFGVAVTSQDVRFVSHLGKESPILRLQDLNGDEDAQDSNEVNVFSNGTCGSLRFSSPTALAVDGKNVLYVADHDQGVILMLQDLNGDKDALDSKECKLFATGLNLPIGLAAQLPPLPALAIVPVSGIDDLAKGNDLLLPGAEGTNTKFTVQVVDPGTNRPVPGVKVACDTLSGCLLCEPKAGQTDAKGAVTFLVSRLSEDKSESTLVVSTLGSALFINVISEVGNPGLSGEWVDLTQTCKYLGQKPLCRITGTLRVFNPGTAIAGPSVVRFFLSADTTFEGTDPVLGDEPVGALGSGVEVLVPLDIRLRPGESASGQFVIAVVDADNDVPEANEENNVVVSLPIP